MGTDTKRTEWRTVGEAEERIRELEALLEKNAANNYAMNQRILNAQEILVAYKKTAPEGCHCASCRALDALEGK